MTWIFLAATLFTTGLLLVTVPRIITTALRTDTIIRRDGYVSRRERPVLFWFGIIFWIVMTAMLIFASGMLLRLVIIEA